MYNLLLFFQTNLKFALYFLLSSRAGEIQQILQFDWFLDQAELSHPQRVESVLLIFVQDQISANQQSFTFFTHPSIVNQHKFIYSLLNSKESHLKLIQLSVLKL